MMTEFKSIFIDTSPFIYYIEKSDLYFEKMKQCFSSLYEQEKSLATSPVTVVKNQRFDYIYTFRAFL